MFYYYRQLDYIIVIQYIIAEVERDSNNKLLSNTLADITGVLTKELECPICTEIMVEVSYFIGIMLVFID